MMRPEMMGADPIGFAALAGVLFFLSVFAGIGLIDDLWDLSAHAKFAVLVALSIALATCTGGVTALPMLGDVSVPLPVLAGIAGAGLWVFATANAANFMDGANGLLAGVMAAAFTALGLCSLLVGAYAAMALCTFGAAAVFGFLPFNARTTALVFLGDVGALFLGALFAVAALLYVNVAPAGALFLCPALMAPILVDVLWTQARRLNRGESLLEAHRDHAYQRRIRSGMAHLDVSRGLWIQAVLCGGLVLAAQALLPNFGPLAGLAGLFACLGVCAWAFVHAPDDDALPVAAGADLAGQPAVPSAAVGDALGGQAVDGNALGRDLGGAGGAPMGAGAIPVPAARVVAERPRAQYARATTNAANPINADR